MKEKKWNFLVVEGADFVMTEVQIFGTRERDTRELDRIEKW